MNKDDFRREKLYQATMSIARKMLSDGLISAEDYQHIDAVFREKYRPVFSLG